MSEPRIFNSIEEFYQHYFPNLILDLILDNLEERLCSGLGMTEPHQHRLSKNKSNPRTGSIEIAIPDWRMGTQRVENIIMDFYSKREYEVAQEHEDGMISVKKGDENYWIFVYKGGTYSINIMKNPLTGFLS